MTSRLLLRTTLLTGLVPSLTLLIVGCGNGASGAPPVSSPVQPAVAVSVSGPTTTQIGGTGQFTATVTNTANNAVTWQVNGVAGGNSTTGTISSSGLYTAPLTLPPSTAVNISAVSQASPNASSTVVDTLYGASMVTAARLLDQASFGPTADAIQHVQGVGVGGYLAEQFAQQPTLLAPIPTSPLPALCLANNSAYPCAESEWWQTAITGSDQLRQRVAFALSEMFVVSTQSIPGQAIPSFHNALATDAFGNFRTILTDVTLSPAMGGYLNMLNSAKPTGTQIANENYARELMQLFTLGLYKLNQDGTVQTDGQGSPIPAYTQAQVQAFARAYTGWTLANAAGGTVTKFPNNSGDYSDPMVSVDSKHDITSKTLLDGTVLPAGQTARQDLDGALTNVFNNSNVGPFVCQQLIQHLVTSTPSPAYVSRVSAVFANNGSGVRGDMKAVITAILTDAEARAGDTSANFNGGHLREPILFLTAMMRGLGFTNTDANSSWFSLSNQSAKLNEEPYRSPSVFNFFPPEYVIPDTQLNAPEFGIENTASAVLRLSLADSIVNNRISGFAVDLSNTSAMGKLAAKPADLVDTLSMLFMHSQMPDAMRTTIVNTITPLTNNAQRTRIAIYLVITSSQYKVIH